MRDMYYPSYHFRPEKNWMNDPNGPVWYQGKYHLFYQHNPYGDQWGNIHWGHAVSEDLIHWEHLPLALYPSTEEGEVHCYSGCAVVQNDLPYLFYTSVGTGERGPEKGAQQWSAVSRDGMRNWEKCGKPAIPESVNGQHKIEMWRDPFLWKEDCWYAILGGTENQKGCLVLYRSEDLQQWEYLNKIYESEEYWLTECPNMIPLGDDRYLILYSPLDAVRYLVAKLDKKSWKLEIEKEGIFDHSVLKRGFYAPNTYLNDPKGRIVIIGWLSEADRAELEQIQGWAGMQSLPREVSVEEDGTLRIRPAEETKLLRKKLLAGGEWTEQTEEVAAELFSAEARAAEIWTSVSLEKNGVFELSFFADQEGKEETRLICDGRTGRVILDRSRSSLYDSPDKTEISCGFEEISGDEAELQLQIFLDHSSVEVFVNGRTTISARVYPKLEQSCRICMRKSDTVKVKELSVWELAVQPENK